MKKRILEIYNDYKEEYLKYYKRVNKKLKKFYKICNLYFEKIKENLLRKENRKKYLTATGILIIVNLMFINLYISFGYYHNESSLSLIKAIVGNMYLNEYDYVLLVYLEETDASGTGSGEYRLTEEIPTIGYSYSGYKCQNNSVLLFDEETKTTSVTMQQKELCSVYFDIIGNRDLTVKIMLEDGIDTENYLVSEKIPAYGYKYNHYECQNNGTILYDSELHSVKLSSATPENCSIYFTKEYADITVNLFIEESYQTGYYKEMISIPANNNYVLNESNSVCKNHNNERVDAIVTYVDGYINVEVSEKVACDVYLDLEDE